MYRVELNHKLKERADKQKYRAIHLNKWENDLSQREGVVDKADKAMVTREKNVEQQMTDCENKYVV